MNLQDAIAQIGEIQTQLERSQTFRGYRSAAVGTTGLLAIVGCAVQYVWLPNPGGAVHKWLALWVVIAMASVVIAGWELMQRVNDPTSPQQARASRSALKQFIPCVAAGGAVTWVLIGTAPQVAWILPGIWSILFSLGVFSSLSILPRGALSIAVHYMMTGIICLQFAQGEAAFAAWTMLVTFGAGQLLSAFVLYYNLERPERQNND